jgi:hypothetical protein
MEIRGTLAFSRSVSYKNNITRGPFQNRNNARPIILVFHMTIEKLQKSPRVGKRQTSVTASTELPFTLSKPFIEISLVNGKLELATGIPEACNRQIHRDIASSIPKEQFRFT